MTNNAERITHGLPDALAPAQGEASVAISIDPGVRRAAGLFRGRLADRFPVSRVLLFGSRARGATNPDSDIDLAVFLSGPSAGFVETKLAMADIAYDLLLETGHHLQPLPIWEEEWMHPDAYANPRLFENIAREGVPL